MLTIWETKQRLLHSKFVSELVCGKSDENKWNEIAFDENETYGSNAERRVAIQMYFFFSSSTWNRGERDEPLLVYRI